MEVGGRVPALARREVGATLGQPCAVAREHGPHRVQVLSLRVTQEADDLEDRPLLAETLAGRATPQHVVGEARHELPDLVGDLA